jgi:hypothetical protein
MDAVMMSELGKNWSLMAKQDRWEERVKSMPYHRIFLDYNCQELYGDPKGRQVGGVGIAVFGKTAS